MKLQTKDKLEVQTIGFLGNLKTTQISAHNIENPVDKGMFESFRCENVAYFIDEEKISDRDMYEAVTGLRNVKNMW